MQEFTDQIKFDRNIYTGHSNIYVDRISLKSSFTF